MYCGPAPKYDEKDYIGVTGTVTGYADYLGVSGTSSVNWVIPSSHVQVRPPEVLPLKQFFAEITSVKPPCHLEPDGVYIGNVKLVDRVVAVR